MRVLISLFLLVIAYLMVGPLRDIVGVWLGAAVGTLFVVLALGFWLWQRRGDALSLQAFRKPKLTELLIVGCFVAVLLSALFAALRFGPVLAIQARDSVVPVENGGINGDSDGPSSPDVPFDGNVEGGIQSGSSERPELFIPRRGKLDLPRFPEVRIVAADSENAELLASKPLYVSMKALSDFDGVSGWQVGNPAFNFLTSDSDGWIDIQPPRTLEPVEYTVFHSPEYTFFYSLQGPVRTELSRLKGSRESFFTLPPIVETGAISRSYRCQSTSIRLEDIAKDELKDLEVANTDALYHRNQFTTKLRGQINTTAVKLRELKGVYNKLIGVRTMLRHNCKYSLDVKNRGGLPPIENFLYRERAGYCVHFATAGVLLCRELGIPSRVVSGFSGGTHFPSRNMWVMYSDDAHAWLEVKLKGYGWVILDTSPEAAVQADEVKGPIELEPFPTAEQRQEHWNDQQMDVLAELFPLQQIYQEAKWVLVAIAVMLSILFALGVVQKIERKKRKKRSFEEDERVSFEEKPYIALFRKVCLLNSLPMMDGDTLRRHMEWLEDKDKTPSFASELLRYHYDTTYRESDVDKKIETELMRQMRKWKG